jgi:glycosyltransferase involved in cell wall biosynthesis
MAQTLLTVSGTLDPAIREKIARGERPRADYIEMARAFDAELMDYARARALSGAVGRALEKIAGRNAMLAFASWTQRKNYRVIFSDGEQVGIPLAALLKFFGRGNARHLMIVHILSVGKKMLFFRALGVQSHIDIFFCYSTWQKKFIEENLRVPNPRVIWTPFMVDSKFFARDQISTLKSPSSNQLCSVGLEFRDYPTLMRAVDGLDAQVVIAAASPWSKRADTTHQQTIPANVSVKKFSQFELRQVYAASRFLVMPLYNVNFQAGVTAILEAMAMERAVICSRTPGQTDVIVEGETGLYVPPEDPRALRQAIEYLLANPDVAERMGKAGRKRIEELMSLDRYVARLSEYVMRER